MFEHNMCLATCDCFGWAWNLGISGRSSFGIFEILKHYGTSCKINILESPLNIPTPTPARDPGKIFWQSRILVPLVILSGILRTTIKRFFAAATRLLLCVQFSPLICPCSHLSAPACIQRKNKQKQRNRRCH